VTVLLLLLAASGCAERSGADVLALREVPAPAGPGSGEPNLVSAHGTAYLSWLEPVDGGGHALRFARWTGDGWSEPGTVAEGEGYFVNWADFPSMTALPDGRLAAHWLVRSGPSTYAYDVHVAQSPDGGRTWSPSVIPHRDGTQTEHGFASLFPWTDGRLGAVWLDGRNFEGHDAAEHGAGAEMTLRHTWIGAAGELGEEVVLDGRVCDCCQTSVALTARGPVAVYRNRSAEEIRDVWIVRHVDGRWTEPRPVHHDGWHITGCPVNGPAAAADGESLAVAWFTAAADTPRVHLAFSADGGATFGAPLRVDDGDPVGRVDVVMLNGGAALVSWLERMGDAAEIRVRRVSATGRAGPATTVSTTSGARASGFPRITRLDDLVVFAWTEAGDPSRVRTAVAPLR
jgi:hypothetical protein